MNLREQCIALMNEMNPDEQRDFLRIRDMILESAKLRLPSVRCSCSLENFERVSLALRNEGIEVEVVSVIGVTRQFDCKWK